MGGFNILAYEYIIAILTVTIWYQYCQLQYGINTSYYSINISKNYDISIYRLLIRKTYAKSITCLLQVNMNDNYIVVMTVQPLSSGAILYQ